MTESNLTVEVDLHAGLSHLVEGDRIRLVRGTHNTTSILFATVAMDGHAVSNNYGSRVGNLYYEDPTKNYINVKFDFTTYSMGHPNSTIYARDDWRLFVSEETALRIVSGQINQGRRAEILKKVAELEKNLAELRAEAETL